MRYESEKILEEAANILQQREAKARYTSINAECEQGASTALGRGIPGLTNEDIVRHHNPSPEQIQRIGTIRAAARNFLDAIDANCGSCADAADAKRKVREAMMTANAAIVLNGAV